MYKLLLSWRYLKTRFIALASIVSVTLGVATLIVVNSVMSGFIGEMQDRLHGILSDVEIASPGLGEISWPELHVREIERIVGDDLQAVTYVVRVPALMNFEFRGRQWTQQIMLMGIDEKTFGQVTDFNPYLLNSNNRNAIDFQLNESGYDERIGECGWEYRRQKEENRQRIEEMIGGSMNVPTTEPVPDEQVAQAAPGTVTFAPLPSIAPTHQQDGELPQASPPGQQDPPVELSAFDPHADLRQHVSPEEMFNPARDQHTGIVLGMAIASRQFMDQEGERQELFMVRPGDDIQITLPTSGPTPSPITENCTIVDFYSSNMHEYDSTFAFMSLRKLQEIRRMIDPVTGSSTVSSIQVKLKDGADLDAVRDKLIAFFPPDQYPYVIQTWQDTQRPLLSAVNMEVTILNILLFLIIAVAGFGILATFFMIVVEKTKDIGILKALGAPSHGVMSIFLSYGVSLGTVGTGVGIVLGLVIVYFINDIAAAIQWATGREIFDPTIYYFSQIPTAVNPMTVFLVALGAVAIAVLASVLPALRAARLHPVEALRYE
ncbi:MAG: FtsX-like permease family protein [Mariniblastus sp.]|nr:FtsX-like permease family protein [Mariniblastus sp.]